MDDQPPEPMAELWAWLAESGYAATDSGAGGGFFGDRLMRMTKGDMAVRAVRDRGQWFLDISCRAWGGGWFDVPLVSAGFDHRLLGVPMTLEDQVSFVKAHLHGWLSDPVDAAANAEILAEVSERRARLRFSP